MKRTIMRLAALVWIGAGTLATLAQTSAPAKDPLAGLTPDQARFFRYFDVNQDGRIMREEYRNVVVRFFEQMDRKHHGWVDDAEIRKAFPAVHANQPIDPKLNTRMRKSFERGTLMCRAPYCLARRRD